LRWNRYSEEFQCFNKAISKPGIIGHFHTLLTMNYAVRLNVNQHFEDCNRFVLKRFFSKTTGFKTICPVSYRNAPWIFLAKVRFYDDTSRVRKEEIAMSFTRPMNVFLVCAAFAFVASMALGIVP
jgi:hypothetical protein